MLLIVGLIIALIIGIQFVTGQLNPTTDQISMAQLAQKIEQGSVTQITVRGDDLTVEMKDGSVLRTRKEFQHQSGGNVEPARRAA